MKVITTLIICLFISTQVKAQSEEAMVESQQKETVFYKKKMVPKGEVFVEEAPVFFTQSILIHAPVEKIWDIIDDTPNFTKWFPGLLMGKMVDPSNKGLGARRIAETKNFNYYEEVIAYEKYKKWGFTMIESNSGAFKSITEMLYFKAVDANTTEVIYKGGYEPKGIFKLMKGIIAKNVIKAWDAALVSLKEYAEG
ncbi:hypothetical protein DNU06_05765 [Putridiphycobacter roseus]|uniref:SRPBCC family protein n=1 Tax=Putridiphycobacter roseus TaxID=2219161 RepID=A0A2W1NR88_9FLAO|nr:SRPBCC family protein [Putridiphycobacter roseus]PZE18122.1 hypothetical protein DNU06_05765 [Putridiphycobacter roseus]